VLVSQGAMRERCNRCGVLVDRHVWKVLASAGSDNASLEPASVINRRSTAPLRRAISSDNAKSYGGEHADRTSAPARFSPKSLDTRDLARDCNLATSFLGFRPIISQHRCSTRTVERTVLRCQRCT
jgi:hypothetical protein